MTFTPPVNGDYSIDVTAWNTDTNVPTDPALTTTTNKTLPTNCVLVRDYLRDHYGITNFITSEDNDGDGISHVVVDGRPLDIVSNPNGLDYVLVIMRVKVKKEANRKKAIWH